ncbi:SixA phosphatase family protein [Celeribacter sp.]|uniref:SixA phosphatase family protein n=1 Tax=Celeribacter sp. TaxID=1890673 RepID=UPI003A91ECCD
MSLRLILMRHAKSSWDDPLNSDYDRPLNSRGRDAANLMGGWLKSKGYLPDEVILSSAARTMETGERVLAAAGVSPVTKPMRALYHAPDFQILRTLAQATGETVLLIAHNPGIGDFASHFAAAPHSHPDFVRYPTAATTVFEVDAPMWKQVQFGKNKVADFAIPRDLA